MIHYKILIVDDDPDDRDIMKDAFEQKGPGHHLTLSSAEEVLSYLQSILHDEDLPKLIITDLNMPGISGIDLLKTLKGMSRYRNIEVVVFSTSSSPRHATLCTTLGAKEFITKPESIGGYYQLAERIKGSV